MKDRVILNGRLTTVENVDRGRLLLYEPQEWVERFQKSTYRRYRIVMVAIGIMVIVMISLFSVMVSRLFAFAIIMEALILIAVLLLPTLLVTVRTNRRAFASGGPVVGLYENGVQVTPVMWTRIFVPYCEIIRVRPSRPMGGLLLYARRYFGSILVPTDLLGPTGVSLLIENAGKPPVAQGPPVLRVYPSGNQVPNAVRRWDDEPRAQNPSDDGAPPGPRA